MCPLYNVVTRRNHLSESSRQSGGEQGPELGMQGFANYEPVPGESQTANDGDAV